NADDDRTGALGVGGFLHRAATECRPRSLCVDRGAAHPGGALRLVPHRVADQRISTTGTAARHELSPDEPHRPAAGGGPERLTRAGAETAGHRDHDRRGRGLLFHGCTPEAPGGALPAHAGRGAAWRDLAPFHAAAGAAARAVAGPETAALAHAPAAR